MQMEGREKEEGEKNSIVRKPDVEKEDGVEYGLRKVLMLGEDG